jgi:hypothetical protein
MSHIIYENQEAIFTFEYEDIYQELIQTIRKDRFHDILMFFKWLQDNSDRGEHDIRIQSDDMYHQENYLSRISYVIKALFSDQKGTIHCKRCNQTISASKIHKEQTPLFHHGQREAYFIRRHRLAVKSKHVSSRAETTPHVRAYKNRLN